MSIKIIKEAILEMMLHNQLDVKYSGAHILSSLTTLALCPSLAVSLSSPFPVTNDADDLQDQ